MERTLSIVLEPWTCPRGRRAFLGPVVSEGLDPLRSLVELWVSGMRGRGAAPRPTNSPHSMLVGLLFFNEAILF